MKVQVMSCMIQSVDDLAQLPDDELLPCLGALRSAIHEAKRQHAAALRERLIAEDSTFEFQSFNWRPRGAQRFNMPIQLSPETPIDEISVRASARDALKELKEVAIGPKTLGRLREVLSRVGLDFLPNPQVPQT